MKTLLPILLLYLGATLHAADFAQTEFKDSKGTVLRYAILKPAMLKPEAKYPLVVSLHGAGGRGKQRWVVNCTANKALSQPAMRQKYPCYIIAPTVGRDQRWDGAPLSALMELIKSSLKEHAIDPARIYVTGQSMGGAGTYSAILAEPNLFAAAVPVCGRGQPDLAKKIVHIPIWIFHGELDRVVPTQHSRDMNAALKKAGGKPTYTEYAGVRHNSWTPAYADKKLWEWLFAQKRKDIKSKLTPKQVLQFFNEVMLGEWTGVDKDTGEVVEKFTMVWHEKHKSVKANFSIFEKGKLTDQQDTSITIYDPKLDLFVEKAAAKNGQPERIRHFHWNPIDQTMTAEVIKPKPQPGTDVKLNWKKTGPNVWNFNIQVYKEGEKVFSQQIIQTRKAVPVEK